jgi:hypothetical protein
MPRGGGRTTWRRGAHHLEWKGIPIVEVKTATSHKALKTHHIRGIGGEGVATFQNFGELSCGCATSQGGCTSSWPTLQNQISFHMCQSSLAISKEGRVNSKYVPDMFPKIQVC